MAKKNVKAAKVGKVSKAKPSKSKLRTKAKHTKAQIEKLNKDADTIAAVHGALTKGQAPKEGSLDAAQLRADLKKDEENERRNKTAEKDLASQLEVLTGMAL